MLPFDALRIGLLFRASQYGFPGWLLPSRAAALYCLHILSQPSIVDSLPPARTDRFNHQSQPYRTCALNGTVLPRVDGAVKSVLQPEGSAIYGLPTTINTVEDPTDPAGQS